MPLSKFRYVGRIVFEASDPASASQQFMRGRSRSCADLQHVISERVAGKNPRQQLSLGKETPKGGAAKPIFEFVHGSPNRRGKPMLDLLGGLGKAINLMQQIVNSLQCRGKLVCILRGRIFQLLEQSVNCNANFGSIGWIGLFAVSDV